MAGKNNAQTTTPLSNLKFESFEKTNKEIKDDLKSYFTFADKKLLESIKQIIEGNSNSELKDSVFSKVSLTDRCKIASLKQKEKDENLISFGCYGGTFKSLKSSKGLDEYYGALRVGRTSTITLEGENLALYTELISDNLWLSSYLGHARVGFGALVSNADSSSNGTTEQFFQAGGNAQLFVQWPAFFWINILDGQPTPIRRLDAFVTLSAGSDIPELGGSVENPAFRFSSSIQGEFTQRTIGGKLRAFITVEGSLMWATPEFYENVNSKRPDLGKYTLWGLPVIKSTVGLDIGEIFRIGATFGTSAAFSTKPLLTVQLLPQ